MAVRKVLQLGDKKLRQKCSNVSEFDKELPKIARDLKDTLTYLQKREKIGRGLAAPQIGYMKNVIFFSLKDEGEFYMVNPKIIWESPKKFEVWDSCFSFGYAAFFVKIKRHKEIGVKYYDMNGKAKPEEFKNDLSELVQHEIDHLHGILATDHLKDVKNIILREEWEKRYR